MNQVEATDLMLGVLRDTFSTSVVLPYEPEILVEGIDRDEQPDIKDSRAFVRVRIRHNVATQRTLGGRGGRKFEEYGLVLVQLLLPWQDGAGLTNAQLLSDEVVLAYRSSAGPVRYSNAHPTEIGRDGVFFQMNVTVNFAYFNYA